jgi:hypothetical protein
MLRLVISVICGVAIPFIYSIIVGPLSTYTENRMLHRFGYIPIGWPSLLLEMVVPLNSFPFRNEDGSALLLIMIVANVMLYGFLSYLTLWAVSFHRKTRSSQYELPPPPSA